MFIENFFKLLKNLNKTIKKLMIVLAASIVLSIFFLIVRLFTLSLICIIIFFITIVVIIIVFFLQENSFSINEGGLQKKLINIIHEKDSIEVSELAKELKVKEGQVRHLVYECIKDKKIDGYTLNGDTVQKINLIKEKKQEQVTRVITCEGCGVNYTTTKQVEKCPYCGRVNSTEN